MRSKLWLWLAIGLLGLLVVSACTASVSTPKSSPDTPTALPATPIESPDTPTPLPATPTELPDTPTPSPATPLPPVSSGLLPEEPPPFGAESQFSTDASKRPFRSLNTTTKSGSYFLTDPKHTSSVSNT